MGAIAVFDYKAWVSRYPEFSQVTAPQALAYFNEASIYHDNTGLGPVNDATQQLVLLNMLTAHIAALNAPAADGSPASPLVGRISSATEGSVSVSVENAYPPGETQWFQQTKYGSAWWAATMSYRTMQYRPGPPSRMLMWW